MMRYKAVYEEKIGFVFPDLHEELNYEVWKQRKNNGFKLLISGLFDGGKYYLEFSPELNLLLISYAEIIDSDITKAKIYLYDELQEALKDFENLKIKPDSRWFETDYFKRKFHHEYVDPKEDHSKMIWRKKGVLWVAQGKHGKFIIRHYHRHYFCRYESKNKSFNLPIKAKISEMKALAEGNIYWE